MRSVLQYSIENLLTPPIPSISPKPLRKLKTGKARFNAASPSAPHPLGNKKCIDKNIDRYADRADNIRQYVPEKIITYWFSVHYKMFTPHVNY